MQLRNWRQSAALVLSPVVVTILLVGFQALSDVLLNAETPFPDAVHIGNLGKCVQGAHIGSCDTLLFAPATAGVEALMHSDAFLSNIDAEPISVPGVLSETDPWNWCNATSNVQNGSWPQCNFNTQNPTEAILEMTSSIAASGENSLGHSRSKFEGFSPGGLGVPCLPCDFMQDNQTVTQYMLDRPNRTQNVVLFLGEYLWLQRPLDSYILYYNISLTQYPFFESAHTMQLKRALDIAQLQAAGPDGDSTDVDPSIGGTLWTGAPGAPRRQASLDVAWRTFPKPKPRIHAFNVVAQQGGQWYILPALIVFYVLLVEIVGEKESRLRLGMRTMGLRNGAFWGSWALVGLAYSVLTSLILIGTGYAAGFEYFARSSFGANFALFVIFGMSLVALAFLLSTLVDSAKLAQTVGLAAVLLSFVFQGILSAGYGGLVDCLWMQPILDWVLAIRYIMQLYPAFNFSKCFFDIAQMATSTIDARAGKVLPGPGFHWSDLHKTRPVDFFGFHIQNPPPSQSILLMLGDLVLFATLALYLDSVMPGQHGSPQHPMCCLGVGWQGRCCGRKQTTPLGRAATCFCSELDPTDVLQEARNAYERRSAAAAARRQSQTSGAASASARGRVPSGKPHPADVPGIASLARIQPGNHSIASINQGDSGLRQSLLSHKDGSESQPADSTWQERREQLEVDAMMDPGVDAAAREAWESTAVSESSEVAVRVLALTKVYRKHDVCTLLGRLFLRIGGAACGCSRGSEDSRQVSSTSRSGGSGGGAGDVHAVQGVSFVARKNECTGLAGANGAGKSSLLHILLGLYLPTTGRAEVAGMDVEDHLDEIRKQLGVCQQHDILWPELTAREHMWLFARIKGVKGGYSDVEAEVEKRLAEVSLTSSADRPAGKFSGGMKRRLSLAIACIGDPAVLIADECSAGLDPVNKRDVWRLLQRLKRGRCVILTSHDLLEAETLSDRVMIMAHGRMWAVGNALSLKQREGSGYRISMSATPSTAPLIAAALQHRLRAAKVAEQDAGNVSFAVPFSSVNDLPGLLEWIETHLQDNPTQRAGSGSALGGTRAALPAIANDPTDSSTPHRESKDTAGVGSGAAAPRYESEEIRESVREWGISMCSLEEVFLSVMRRADAAVHRAGDGTSDDDEDNHSPTAFGNAFSGEAGELGDHHSNKIVSRERKDGMASKSGHDNDAIVSYGCRALAIKYITLIGRQQCLCACQIITPLIVMGLLSILQVIVRAEFGATQAKLAPSVLSPLNLNLLASAWEHGFGSDEFDPAEDDVAEVEAGYYGHSIPAADWHLEDGSIITLAPAAPMATDPAYASLAKPSPAPVQTDDSTGGYGDDDRTDDYYMTNDDYSGGRTHHHRHPTPGNQSQLVDGLEFFLFSVAGGPDSALAEHVGLRDQTGNGTGFLGHIPQTVWRMSNGTNASVPYFLPRPDPRSMQAELMHDLGVLNNASLLHLDNKGPCRTMQQCPAYLLPDGTVEVSGLETTVSSVSGSWTIAVNDARITQYHRPNNFTRIGFHGMPKFVRDQAVQPEAARVALHELLVAALAKEAGLRRGTGFAPAPTPIPYPGGNLTALDGSVKVVATMPQILIQNLESLVQVFGAFLYPIGLTLQLPLFSFTTVLERETGLLQLQRAMGMRDLEYFGTNYALNMGMYCAVVGFFWAVGLILQFSFFVSTSPMLLFFFFIGWGLALTSLAAFVASLLASRRVATIVGYAVALLGTLIGTVLADGIYGNVPPFSYGARMPSWLHAMPIFALCRGIYLMNFACLFRGNCLDNFEQATAAGTEMRWVIVWLFIDAVLYKAAAVYLEQVLPGEHHVPSHPLCCLRACTPTGWLESNCSCTTRRSATPNDQSVSDKQTRDMDINEKDMDRSLLANGASAEHAQNTGDPSAGSPPTPAMCLGDSAPLRAGDERKLLSLFPHATSEAHAFEQARGEDPMVTEERRTIAKLLGLAENCRQSRGNNQRASEMDACARSSSSPLIVRALRREFDTPMGLKVAVSDMNYVLEPGAVLGVIGPNGCGKSTSFACISATIPATAGDAWVGGHHIDRNPEGVHLSLGLCPQHSVLWDDLSVQDHLYFYARLKGVQPDALEHEVLRQLRAVDLDSVMHRQAGQLSGGMRRRLSTAISLTGRSVLSYLDEPTAGLDLASRRRLWRVIERAKRLPSHSGKARSMVLTSHSMDECELLSDRIAIVCGGRVRAIGTPQTLRNRFGQGYRLFINFDRTAGRETAIQLVHRLFPNATQDLDYQGYASFLISTGGMPLSQMFQLMHVHANNSGISDWGVGQVTLEDVFARVVQAYDGSSEAAAHMG